MFISVVIAFVGLDLWLFFWLPSHIQIDVVPSNDPNVLHLSLQTVPTVINGVTTATSIIIGFSGTLIGLLLHEMPKKKKQDKKARMFLLVGVTFAFALIILQDFQAFVFLLMGGAGFLFALELVLSGLLTALLVLVGIFIFIGFRLGEQEETERTLTKPDKTEQTEIPNSHEDNKQITVSETIEKKDIEYFINKHYKMITTMGVFGALTAFLTQLQEFSDLASVTLIIFLFLTWELLIKFPDSSESTLKLFSLGLLFIALLFGVGFFVLVRYVTKYYSLFALAFSFGIYALTASKVVQWSKLFERLKRRTGEKHYEKVQRLVLLGMVILLLILAIYTTDYVVSYIQNAFGLQS